MNWTTLEQILEYAGIIYVTGLLLWGVKRLIQTLTKDKEEKSQ